MLPKGEYYPAADLQSHGVKTGSQFCLQRGHWDSLPRAGRSRVALLLCLTREHPQVTPHPKTLRIKRFLLPNSQLMVLPHRPRRLVRAISSSTDQRKSISPSLPGTGLPKAHTNRQHPSVCRHGHCLAGWMAGTATGHGIEEVWVGLSSDR